jgi:uncharacterized repeat protein (TIGR01451 family)/CSLREA domain-containing protein
MSRVRQLKAWAAPLGVSLIALAMAFLVGLPAGARALTVWHVNSTADNGPGSCLPGPKCTLRDAIASASAGDEILVPKGTYALATNQLQISKNVTIVGAGANLVTIKAPRADRVFEIDAGVALTMVGVTVTGGAIDGNGGGFLVFGTLNLYDSHVTNNLGLSLGGGIYSVGTVLVVNTTISGNNSSGGGGIFNDTAGKLTVEDSTIARNSTKGQGGGIGDASTNVTTITNTTIAANTASGSGNQGGGIYDANGRAGLFATNVTIDANSAPIGANVYFNNLSAGGLENTIVANPLGGGSNCGTTGAEPKSLGHNLEDDAGTVAPPSCGFVAASDLSGVNPKLGPLTSNGGPTKTMALLSGSPAIDHGMTVPGVTTDQRGDTRPVGAAPDIGAYEYGALVDVRLVGIATNPVQVGHHLTYRLTVSNLGPTSDTASGVRVIQTLPAGVSFDPTGSSGSCAPSGPGKVACVVGNLASGKSIVVKVVVVPSHTGITSSTATSSSDGTDPNPGNNTMAFASSVRDIPAVITNAANPVAYRGATVHGSVNANNAPTKYWFEYGSTTAYGSKTPVQGAAGLTATAVLSKLHGLAPGKLYHFRVVAQNALGTVRGADQTFFTAYVPVIHANPPRVRPGENIHVYGSVGVCPPGSTVTVVSKAFSDAHTYQGEGAIYTTVKTGGLFSIHAQIPDSRKAGAYKISALCGHFP